jgi:hypothetical protein
MSALKSAHSQASMCYDPILSLAGVSDEPIARGQGTAFILRGPLSERHKYIASRIMQNDAVFCLAPSVDHTLAEMFPTMSFALTIDQLVQKIACFDTVVSERYHGCIVAMLNGKRTLGFPSPDPDRTKIEELFSLLGLETQVYRGETLSNEAEFPYLEVRRKILRLRRDFESQVRSTFGSFLTMGGLAMAGRSSASPAQATDHADGCFGASCAEWS